jgi:hypothetical protein
MYVQSLSALSHSLSRKIAHKKPANWLVFYVVPRAGLEPATLGLEVLCSIQLSYQGIAPLQSIAKTRTK